MEEGEEMSKGKEEGSALNGDYPVVRKEHDVHPVYREKQILKGSSQGHTGPGGAENPNDAGGNTEAMLKIGRHTAGN